MHRSNINLTTFALSSIRSNFCVVSLYLSHAGQALVIIFVDAFVRLFSHDARRRLDFISDSSLALNITLKPMNKEEGFELTISLV
jgi:hypothetical protein